MTDRDEFLYPRSRYYGEFKPEHLIFNSNLQEFAQRVSVICNLQSNGKLTPEEAYAQIKALWKQLKCSKKQLGIGEGASESEQRKIKGDRDEIS